MVQSLDETRRRSPEARVAAAGRIPPHNLEAEESLLGAMMLSREAITAAVEVRLEGGDFYKPAHGVVFDAALALHARGEPIDPVSMAEELRRSGQLEGLGGSHALLRIQSATPASANSAHYAQIVAELSMLRKLIATAGDIQEMAYASDEDVDDTLDHAEALIFEVAERRTADTLVPLHPALEQTLLQLEALYDRDTSIVGVPTGYHDLDEMLLGLQPSTLSIVAGRPGRCCSSRWRWVTSSSPSDYSRPRRRSTRANCRPVACRSTSGPSSTRRSAGSRKRRSSSTTTRTAR